MNALIFVKHIKKLVGELSYTNLNYKAMFPIIVQ